jgi:hypothetical protein
MSSMPRIAEAAVERARLSLVPRRSTRSPRLPFVALVTVLLIAGVAGLLLFNTSLQQSSFTASRLEERASVLAAQEQSLKLELATVRDPQKVAARAQRLGMVPAGTPAFLLLGEGRVLGKPSVASADDTLRITPLPTEKPARLRPPPLVLERVPTSADREGRLTAALDAASQQ